MSTEKLYAARWKDYELIDAGGEKKLERWGDIITIRPDRQAYFKSGLPFEEWYEIAHWEFVETKKSMGKWKRLQADAPESWTVEFDQLTFHLELTKYKHIGLFPEQVVNWRFISEHLGEGQKMLNLFAHTGAASLVGKKLGAEVSHVDSVKQVLTWANKNMESSGLDGIRWVLEDAMKFAQRELKRGNKYDLILMDPPAWGIGAKNEKWKIEDQLPVLMETAYQLLNPNGHLILNTYSPRLELGDIQQLGAQFFNPEKMECTELWMKTYTKKDFFFGHLLRAQK